MVIKNDNGEKLVHDKQIGHLSTLPKVFEISYDIKVMGFGSGWKSVFHLTTGGNGKAWGQQIPGVQFCDNKMVTTFAINGDGAFWKFHENDVPTNKWTNFRITQTEVDGKFMFCVFQEQKKLWEAENNQAQDFKDVKILMGDSRLGLQDAFIRNIRVDNSKYENN